MSEYQVRHQWQGALKICYFPIGGAAGNCFALRLIFLSIPHHANGPIGLSMSYKTALNLTRTHVRKKICYLLEQFIMLKKNID